MVEKSKRVTLAFTFLRPYDTLLDVLQKVTKKVMEIGICINRLYVDREFARIDIIKYLKEQSFVSVAPLLKKGE